MPKQSADLKEVAQYAKGVVSGKILTNELVRLCCERHLRDLKDGHERGLYFCQKSADHILQFFHFLKHSKGEWAGADFTLSPWQKFNLAVTFGWKKRADGLRRFRTAYNELPRKNGKSTLAAGVGLYLFFADGEPGAEVYTAATKRDQARIVHSEAVRMVRASSSLLKMIEVFRDNLSCPATSSKFEPLGADEDTLDGLNVHGAIIDEVHAHRTRGVYDVLDTATGSRRQPLIFTITTAGADKESICWELHDYAEKILRGILKDDTFFGFIACADEKDDWSEERTWRKANPNYGISIKPDDMERKAAKAKELVSYQNTFRRLHLNSWTEQWDRWIPMEKWELCSGAINKTELEGKECFAGLDLSTTTDISALVLAFRLGGRVKLLPFFWVPKDNIRERAIRDRVPYDVWVREGFIKATEGNTVDYDVVRSDINQIQARYDLKELAFDPWNATQLSLQLQGDGVKVIPFRQGFASMSAPSKEFEKLIVSGKLEHGDNPVLKWMVSNVAIRLDAAGNIKPAKDKSSERIDGVVASIMAIGTALLNPEGPDFVYNTRGLYVG